jgi:hypothetical protein
MPILPLDHPEPFSATLGVMLYPATDEADTLKARGFAAQVLAKALRRFKEEGGDPPFEILGPIYLDAGEWLDDLEERAGGAAERPARCSRRCLRLQIPTLHSPPGNTRSGSLRKPRSAIRLKVAARTCCKRKIVFSPSLISGPPGQSGKENPSRNPRLGMTPLLISRCFLQKRSSFGIGGRRGDSHEQEVNRHCRLTSGASPTNGNRRRPSQAGPKQA